MVEDPLALDVNWGTIRKLEYLGDYLTAYCRATQTISERGGTVAYLDPFAGTGHVRDEDGQLRSGSADIALNLWPQFNSFAFADASPVHADALRTLVTSTGHGDLVSVREGDANELIDELLGAIPRQGGAGFAFIDPPGLQARWTLVTSIARHRKRGNKVELFILFPFNMAVVRFLVREGDMTEHWPDSPELLDGLMPDPWRWRAVYASVRDGLVSRNDLRRRFLYLYWQGLRSLGYRFVGPPKMVFTSRRRPLYAMFFASDHAVGHRIMDHVMRRQHRLDDPISLPNIEMPYEFQPSEDWYESLIPPSN